MIYLVLFCYCFRVIPILIMKNSFILKLIQSFMFIDIYIYTEKINFLHLYAHILWISSLIAYFAKFYIWSQTPKKKIIANNYIELKPNEFFCVHKLHKLISPKKMTFLESKCKYLQVAACRKQYQWQCFFIFKFKHFYQLSTFD